MHSRPDGFMLYGKVGVDFFSTSEFVYPNMKNRLLLIRVGPIFYMISDNPNVSLRIVECSLYTGISHKDDYHKKFGHACICARGVQILSNCCKDLHQSCQTKLGRSRKPFQQCFSSSDPYCKE